MSFLEESLQKWGAGLSGGIFGTHYRHGCGWEFRGFEPNGLLN